MAKKKTAKKTKNRKAVSGKTTGKGKTKKVASRKSTKKAAKKTGRKKTTAKKTAGKKNAKKTTQRKTASKSAKTSSKKKTSGARTASRSTAKKGASKTSKARGGSQPARKTARKTTATSSASPAPRKTAKKKAVAPRPIPASGLATVPEDQPMPKTRLTAKQLQMFKELLLAKRRDLLGDVRTLTQDALGRSRQDSTGDLSSMPIHMADIGSDNWEQDFTIGLIANEQQLVREIDAALERIEDGTYGICLATHKPIALTRLRAKPWAKWCIEYARQREMGRY